MQKKNYFKWNEIPWELQQFFIIRLICCIGGYILFFIFMISTGMYKEALYMMGFLTLYVLYQLHNYYEVISGNVLVYEGTCEQKRNALRELQIPSIGRQKSFSFYGKGTVIVACEDEKFILPCPNSSPIYENNTVRFYVSPQNIYAKGDNCFVVTNPLLVKVCKL